MYVFIYCGHARDRLPLVFTKNFTRLSERLFSQNLIISSEQVCYYIENYVMKWNNI